MLSTVLRRIRMNACATAVRDVAGLAVTSTIRTVPFLS
jgi:hypothetical protein